MMLLEPLSTRLFPKNEGATGYRITGLASRCDWVILSDYKSPTLHLHRNRDTESPSHIFLSLRSPFAAIRYFADCVLPALTSDFVLVTGSEDVTLPHQIDARLRPFNTEEERAIARILGHPGLVHWYVENLDDEGLPKCSPIPLGLVFPDGGASSITVPASPRLRGRDLRVLCAHRHREGRQWESRREVSRFAAGPWYSFCTTPEGELPQSEFLAAMEAHAFVVCVEGGGLDPSPKAWAALLHGAIPIIRRTALMPAYARLPVVFVQAWRPEAIDASRLCKWRDDLSVWFDDRCRREEVIRRLGLDYWWSYIERGKPIRTTDGIAVMDG
ncbi:MAG: hypothetical protein LJE69_19075 [Thiohalocapsa sp.]|uniref:hypothetical protein n=1 Tax=Thiohalocapsa sp. TaxID=2497641 RepID=UPI0025EEE733|nr:hypothetical protein [Thiohalocapsa sp.]MCG6943341.1 hypothetical protein [Thiohalocapsa sp.]